MYQETKKRSIIKTSTWRIVAILNSFLVLLACPWASPLVAALLMNATGFAVYYFFERYWNNIQWGKIKME